MSESEEQKIGKENPSEDPAGIRRRLSEPELAGLCLQPRQSPGPHLGPAEPEIHLHRSGFADRQRLRHARRLCLHHPRPDGARQQRGRGFRRPGPRDRPCRRAPRRRTLQHGNAARIPAIFVGVVTGSQDLAGLANSGAAAYLQSYSRDQEYQADLLGVRYLTRTNYDPYGMASFLGQLQAKEKLDAAIAGRPEMVDQNNIMSTHPRTADRIQRAIQEAGGTQVGNPDRRARSLSVEDRRPALRRRARAGLHPDRRSLTRAALRIHRAARLPYAQLIRRRHGPARRRRAILFERETQVL